MLSVQFSCSVLSNSLRPHELHHSRPPCSSPIPGAYSNSSPPNLMMVMPSNHLVCCHPLLLQPSIFPSIRIFSSESVLCIRWPKYWNFSFSIGPSSEYLGLTGWISLQSKGLSRVFPNTAVGCHFLLQCMKVKVKLLSHGRLFVTPRTVVYQAPPSMGFSRQEYFSRGSS